jgi:predicted ATPase/DNA-binding CsgD family transcriptional regulator
VSMLPAPLTRFVGREAELSEAAALLGEARLLTLTGPGGAGKTRLAVRLAASVTEHFPDGVWFVDFSPLPGGEFVWDEVANTLGVSGSGPGTTVAEALGRHLTAHRALVVLDNCEHVVASAADVAAKLLAAAPGLKIVATSREPLAVGGEVTWSVPPLSEADGIDLFIDRAKQVRPRFRVRDEDAEDVRSICRRLDGLPLAIELAAARVRALDPAYIASGLKDHLALLPSGPRSAPQRQSTLAASFDWSHELLPDAERALLRQLSVFAGGFDVEAALAVCPAATLELLAALTDRSLIMLEPSSDQAGPRYRMLETVREFAAEHLDEADEVELIRSRHRDHYLRLAETAEPNLMGADEDRWRARLRTEHDNLRAAMAWSRDHGDAEALARMVVALGWFLETPRWVTELRMWLQSAELRLGEISPGMAARIRSFQCVVAVATAEFGELPTLANDALTLARAAGDKREEAVALSALGMMAGLVGGAEAMRPCLEEALHLARSAGFAQLTTMALSVFVLLRFFRSDPDESRRLSEEAVARAKTGANRHNTLMVESIAGMAALLQGRLAEAARMAESVVAEGRPTRDFNYMGSLLLLGWVAMLRGDFDAARDAINESLGAAQRYPTDAISGRLVGPLAQSVLGAMELAGGDADRARDAIAPLVGAMRATPFSRWSGVLLVVLAEAQLALGEINQATNSLDEAESLARPADLIWVLGRARRVRGKLLALEGDIQGAESLAHEAMSLGREAGDQIGLVDALELLARLVAEQSSPREAVRLWAAAESMRAGLGYVRFPVEQGPYDAAVASIKEALGPEEFAAAWAEGAKLSVEEAIAYAARGRGERKRPTTGWASLTPSELEVVRLVGEHLSNPEIAARLFVSRATVKSHLLHIFSKLGIDSRSELAAEVIKRGIVRQTEQGLRK